MRMPWWMGVLASVALAPACGSRVERHIEEPPADGGEVGSTTGAGGGGGAGGAGGPATAVGASSSGGQTSSTGMPSEPDAGAGGAEQGCAPSVYSGSLSVTHQDGLEDLRGVTVLDGTLSIGGDVSDLSPLACLKT